MKTININLLGEGARPSGGLAIPSGLGDIDPVLAAIAGLGLIVALAVPNLLTWGVDRFLVEPADRQISANKEEIKRNQSGSLQLVTRQKAVEALEADYKVVQGIIGQGGTWASILEELRNITPTDLWLTSLKTETGHLEISGLALDYKAVAYFYTNFQNSRNFAGPVLGTISQENAGTTPAVRFTLKASIIAPGMTE